MGRWRRCETFLYTSKYDQNQRLQTLLMQLAVFTASLNIKTLILVLVVCERDGLLVSVLLFTFELSLFKSL